MANLLALTAFFTPSGECTKQTQIAIPQLSRAVCKYMFKDLQEKKRGCFDAHTRDYGCERIAFSVYRLIHNPEVEKALEILKEIYNEAPEKAMLDRNVRILLGCYFLRFIRIVRKNLQGREHFECSLTLIDSLAPNIQRCQKHKLIADIQIFISKASAEMMEEESLLISQCLKSAKKIQEASLVSNLKLNDRFVSDTFYVGCLTIHRLQALKAPVFIKKMVEDKKGGSFGFLCQSLESGGEFQVAEALPHVQTEIFVFEGDVRVDLDLQRLKSKFVQYGITTVLFCLNALDEKKYVSDEAVIEFKEKASALECEPKKEFFKLDHIYLSTLEEEIKMGVKV